MIEIDNRRIINFSDETLPDRDTAIYSIATKGYIFQIGVREVDVSTVVDMLTSSKDSLYIISRMPLLEAAMKIAEMEARTKKKKHAFSQEDETHHLREETLPMMSRNSEAMNRHGYNLEMVYEVSREMRGIESSIQFDQATGFGVRMVYTLSKDKHAKYPVLSATIFANRFCAIDRPDIFVDARPMSSRFSLYATDENVLVTDVERIEHDYGNPFEITQEFVVAFIRYIFRLPLVINGIVEGKEPIPTEAWINEHKDELEKDINIYRRNFSKATRHLSIGFHFSPVQPEHAFQLMTRVEIAAMPAILDYDFVIERRKKEDPLFDKLAGLLNRKKTVQITISYGALLDMGQLFNFGEVDEMIQRLRPIF